MNHLEKVALAKKLGLGGLAVGGLAGAMTEPTEEAKGMAENPRLIQALMNAGILGAAGFGGAKSYSVIKNLLRPKPRGTEFPINITPLSGKEKLLTGAGTGVGTYLSAGLGPALGIPALLLDPKFREQARARKEEEEKAMKSLMV